MSAASSQLGLAALNQYCAGYNCFNNAVSSQMKVGVYIGRVGGDLKKKVGRLSGCITTAQKPTKKGDKKTQTFCRIFHMKIPQPFFSSRYSSIQLLFHTRLGIFRFLDSSKGDRQTDFLRTYCQKVPRPAADFSYCYFLSLINRKERPPY